MAKLKVNGKSFKVNVDENMPLLWALRDELQLTGTKFGCGKGLCGACTVHLGDRAVRACSIPVAAAKDQEITTIEGLTSGEHNREKAGRALLQTWREFKVPQCGYCQPGQLMAASALLSAQANPDDEAIKQAMSGNICRCGTYPRIHKAIKAAAQQVNAEERDHAE